MMQLSDDEFWKSRFDLEGNFPFHWSNSAYNLLTSANVLDRFRGDYRCELLEDTSKTGGIQRSLFERMSVVAVSAMLRAMATECLLKALWVKYGGTLVKDGKYLGVLENKSREHQLNELAKAVSIKGNIQFTDRELKLLEYVSYWIMSGRYPIQKQYQYLVPFKKPDGSVGSSMSWTDGDPFEELRALIIKIQAALGMELKFESD
jgi:hypothetical protein